MRRTFHVQMLVFLLFIHGHYQGIIKPEDFEECKLTQEGTEYFGKKSNTISGWKCQNWEAVASEKKLFTSILDTSFPDASRKNARNYCRNPTKDHDGPWCYTLDAEHERQTCGIPFCELKECRLTGYGQEYQGKIHTSITSTSCLAWSGRQAEKFGLEGRITCANPSADQSGPWCMVLSSQGEQQELCDVPVCDFPVCGRISTRPTYSTFTELRNNSLTFSVRLWNPDIKQNATRGPHIFLSSINSLQGNFGFEVELGLINFGGGITLRRWPEPANPIEYADVVVWKPKRPPYNPFASGISWTKLWVTWDDTDIRVGEVGLEDVPRVSLEIHNEKIQYYSLSGPRAMWEFQECCEVHVTSNLEFTQFWPLQRTEIGYQLDFNIKGFHSVVIQLSQGPDVSKATMQIVLQERGRNIVYLIKNNTKEEKLIQNYENDFFTDPFQWDSFSLSVFGDMLQVMWKRSPTNTATLLEVHHPKFHDIRWFSIGSNNTLTHWTLQCKPPENDTTVDAVPPECSPSTLGIGYTGHQSASASGRPCIPWSLSEVPDEFKNDKLFPDGSVDTANNLCRNPDKHENGTWCFTSAPNFPRESCNVRACRFQNCRMAGTGNDYMGTKNTTLSGRTCQTWLENYPHMIPKSLHNVSRYPERDVEKASNFCRNPNRNMTGSWCYTTDPHVEFDVCDVKNCEKQEECTMLTVQSPPSSNMYILPKWKVEGLKFWLKEWDPERPDGIKLYIKPLNGNESYVLLIGSQDNQAIELYYEKDGRRELKKEKASPHIIPIGKWGGFWLRVDTGLVQLGYENVEDPIFKWKDRSMSPINPMLLGVGSVYHNLIGIHFPCDGKECHTQHFKQGNMYATYELQENVYPISMWKPYTRENIQTERTFEIYVRGKGRILIQFFQFPGHEKYYSIMIGRMIYFAQYNGRKRKTLISEEYDTFLFEEIKWSKFTFRFNETDINMTFRLPNATEIVHHYTSNDPSIKFFFYYFVFRTGGAIDWSANCKPADLDGDPRNGGWSKWSPWNCSVACGGGEGFRKRTCNNPEPNVFGKYCKGSGIIYGRCNTSPCGQVSPDAMKAVKAYMNSKHYSYLLEVSDSFNHTCNPPVLEQMKGEIVNVKIVWTRNGFQLKENDNSTTLMLQSVNATDAGVYALIILSEETGSHTTLCVFTLGILMSLAPREGDTLHMQSNALALDYLYPDLKLRWVLGTHTWKNFGVGPLAAVEELEIPDVTRNLTGYWSCVVTQIELDFSWTTAWYNITVRPPMSFTDRLLEDPIFSKVFRKVEKFGGRAFVIPVAILSVIVLVASFSVAILLLRSWQRMRL